MGSQQFLHPAEKKESKLQCKLTAGEQKTYTPLSLIFNQSKFRCLKMRHPVEACFPKLPVSAWWQLMEAGTALESDLFHLT